MTSASPAADARRQRRPANAFGLLRLIMAGAVIVSHAFPIGGFGSDPSYALFRKQADVGILALLGFFAISGYLITRSARAGGVLPFLWRRALRILPAYWVVLLAGALVIGPISYAASHGGLGGYWHLGAEGPADYVVRNSGMLIVNYEIDGVFADSPYQRVYGVNTVNGSVWTLFFEVACYLAVAAAMGLGLLRSRRRLALPVLLAAGLVVVQFAGHAPAFARLVDAMTFGAARPQLYLAFGCGAVAALFPDRIRWSVPAAAAAVVVLVSTLLLGGFAGIGVVALSYAVLAAAHLAPVCTHRVGAVNDISYGVYIYAWPVAMLLAQLELPRAGPVPYLAATTVCTVPLAAASWFLVERPALRLKSRGPGHGAPEREATAPDRRATALDREPTAVVREPTAAFAGDGRVLLRGRIEPRVGPRQRVMP